MLFKDVYVVKFFCIQKIVIENVSPYIIETFLVFIVFLSQIEPNWMINEETFRNILDWVTL